MTTFAKNRNEMEEERESVWIAVSLTAGVAATNYSFAAFYSHSSIIFTISLLLVPAFAAAGLLCHSINCRILCRGQLSGGFHGIGTLQGRLLLGTMFFFAGAGICAMNMLRIASFPESAGPVRQFASSSAENLKNIIDSIDYGDPVCNAVAKALFTGDRSGIDSRTTGIFRQSGASHLLALSGMHMGVIYVILSRILSIAGNSPAIRHTRSVLTIAGTGFFTLMTGASDSASRAFLFIMLNETAKISGRKTDGATLLCTSLMIQLAIKPGAISSTGFQLSYLAMTGIFTLYPALKKMWPQQNSGRKKRTVGNPMEKIWDLCAMSISCQLFTGPLAWLKFGTFPQYFLITNLFCIPLMSLIMFSTAAVLILTAAGACPDMLTGISESLIQTMLFVLGTISSM